MVARNSPLQQSVNWLKPGLCYVGKVEDRGTEKTFGILNEDRLRHIHVIGKTGMGKSTLLENMVLQDIYNGEGVGFIDPHGESVKYILDRIPPHRYQDVVYFNPADIEYPIGFNILSDRDGEPKFLIVSGVISIFKKIWRDMWSARMEYILNNALLAVMDSPDNTLLSVLRMFTDNQFKQRIIKRIKDPLVLNFWTKEYFKWSEGYRLEATAAIQNKIGQFFNSALIRYILGQTESAFSLSELMNNRKILLVNLSKGEIGEDASKLLGSMLVTKLQLSAMSRSRQGNLQQKPNFYLYIDEFQNFVTDSFATILSEARKYKLSLIVAHQYMGQLEETSNQNILKALLGNAGTNIVFNLGAVDAELLANEFMPFFQKSDLMYLNKGQVVIKMLVRGQHTTPFLATTMPPMFQDYGGNEYQVISHSRQTYGRPKEMVARTIEAWLENRIPVPKLSLLTRLNSQSTPHLVTEPLSSKAVFNENS